jgi:DNA-binding transcriptional LysR family regulator
MFLKFIIKVCDMPRNMDLTALRSFVAVVDAGGVTKASGHLNLTQSAVSMQLKRLEEMLGVSLFDRSARRLDLTGAGEQMLGYARRMLQLNDEVLGRLTGPDFEGELTLGVPHDIVYPAIPRVLHRFATAFPRMKVNLVSSYTARLKRMFARGEVDVILTTEGALDLGGETLMERSLVWVGAENGQVWKQRPLRLAFEHARIFRGPARPRRRSTRKASLGKWPLTASRSARSRHRSAPIWRCMPVSRGPSRLMSNRSTMAASCRICRASR